MNVRQLKLDELERIFKCRHCDQKCVCVESTVDWDGVREYRLVATCEKGESTKWHATADDAINGWNTITTYVGD